MLREIKIITRGYRHFTRYRQITLVLLKHGLGDLVTRLGLHKQLGIGKKTMQKHHHARQAADLTRWQRVVLILQELGVSFVKLGQLASTRPDLIPPEACSELEKLQDTVKPFPFEQVKEIVEAELGKPLEQAYKSFCHKPIASASVSQVHKAVLPDGSVVAVKVQRPDIRKTLEVDLDIMFHLAVLTEKHFPQLDTIDPVGVVSEFSRAIKRELDFENEAGNIERFRRNFTNDKTVHIPKVYRDFTTGKVLTMEYLDGVKVSDIDTLARGNYDTKLIAKRGANFILKQIFEDGFFHGDPHPGNILILPDNVIGPLDYGMTGSLTGKNRDYLGDMLAGIIRRNARQMAQALIGVSRLEAASDIESLEADMNDFVEQYLYLPLKDIRMNRLFAQLLQILMQHKIKLPPVFYLLFKALIMVEGNGRRIDPDFEIIEHMRPFVIRFMKKRFALSKLKKDFLTAGLNWQALLCDLPGDMRHIIGQVKHGKVHIEFEHKGLEPMLKTHERISNRITYGMVLSSLIIGSSLVVLSGLPPKWHNIPLIGIAGFIAAGILGFTMLTSIFKQDKK